MSILLSVCDRTRTVVALVAIVWVAAIQPAAAQTDSGDEITVKEAYRAGMEHYKAGEYERAIEEFRRVLDKKPHPVLFFNLSQAYIRLGDWKKAEKFAERAARKKGLDEKTTARNRGTLTATDVVRSASETGGALATSGSMKSASSGSAMRSGSPSSGSPRGAGRKSGGGGFGALGWTGVGLVGTGIGAGIWSALVDAQLDQMFQTWNRECRDEGGSLPENCQNQREEIRAQQMKGRVLLYSGIGLAAAGATLITVELLKKDRKAARRVVPQITTSRGGFRIGVSLTY